MDEQLENRLRHVWQVSRFDTQPAELRGEADEMSLAAAGELFSGPAV
jgi:hypothetical protein